MIAMNRRYLSLTSLLTATMLLPMAFVRAQSDGMNFVHSRIMLDSVGTSASAQIDYYDGLGRKIETMMRGASPSGADIVIASTYDEYPARESVGRIRTWDAMADQRSLTQA